MATATFIETFFNFEDAVTWIEGQRMDHNPDMWSMKTCGINFINEAYRASISFESKRN